VLLRLKLSLLEELGQPGEASQPEAVPEKRRTSEAG
jgi:hypothetical protein